MRFGRLHPVLLVCCFVSPAALRAQTSYEETLLEAQAESSEQSELVEQLRALQQHPLDLNSATFDALMQLPQLSVRTANLIIRQRRQTGPFRAKSDLLRWQVVSQQEYDRIKDFVTVTTPAATKRGAVVAFRSRVQDFIDVPRGYQDGTYEGTKPKLYNRLVFRFPGRIHGGILTEKDSGEKDVADLKLFFLTFSPLANSEIVVGDFQIEAGQGLVLWSPYGFSKSADAIYPIRRTARGLRGYTAADENAAFRGIALQVKTGRSKVLAFASRAKRDATEKGFSEVSTLGTSGLHRNPGETAKKDALSESAFGGRVQFFLTKRLRIGTTVYTSTFDKRISPSDPVRRHFAFSGSHNTVYGADVQWFTNSSEVFAEVARAKSGGLAGILGSILDFKHLKLAVHYRDYARDFQNLHAFAFADRNGKAQNERGYYLGLFYQPWRMTRINVYYDIFSRSWRTFSLPAPGSGSDFLLQVQHRWSRRLTTTLRLRDRHTPDSGNFKDMFGRTVTEITQNRARQLRLQMDYSANSKLHFRSRIEYRLTSTRNLTRHRRYGTESGFLFYQQIGANVSRRLRFTARWSTFDTDTFASRVYQYENDLPGVLTNRVLFGRGSRWFVLLRYQPFRALKLTGKYAETYRDDVAAIGTGPDQIAGHLDRRLGLQVDANF